MGGFFFLGGFGGGWGFFSPFPLNRRRGKREEKRRYYLVIEHTPRRRGRKEKTKTQNRVVEFCSITRSLSSGAGRKKKREGYGPLCVSGG